MADKKKIVVLETGATYSSVSAAARALGIDPANIRKTLSGKRNTAGGLHFTDLTGKRVTKAAIERELGKYTKKAVDKEIKKVYSAEARRLVSVVHDKLVSLNLMRRNSIKEGVYSGDTMLQNIYSHADKFGTGKTGGFIVDPAHIRKYATVRKRDKKTGKIREEISADKLRKFLDDLSGEQQKFIDEEYYSNKSKNRNIASYAAAHGLSNAQAAKYWHILPVFYDLLEAANTSDLFQYSSTLTDIEEYMQNDVPEDELLRYIIEMKRVAQSNSKEELTKLIKKWRPKTVKWERYNELDEEDKEDAEEEGEVSEDDGAYDDNY